MGDIMRYSGLIRNDLASAPGISVSFFTQGCPHHCSGCHNPETWSFDGGLEFTNETLEEILIALRANGVERSLCIQGGEPMCEQNLLITYLVCSEAKKKYPTLNIYLWTGYLYEDLLKMENPKVRMILDLVDVLIDGPYIAAERDITLKMRGSKNQRIIDLRERRKNGREER